ncbi:MAG: hypothetical protein KAX99_05480 [Azonexus sp.]|nr:hypothetical protein [Azonexus sp.]
MSTVTTRGIKNSQFTYPAGNKTVIKGNFTTSAAGVAANSDLATAVQINDVVRIGFLPAGAELQDAQAIVSDAFTAATTADIGFLYADGVDSAVVPQDAAYFFAALATSATGRTRSTVAKAPVRLPKDAFLVLTRKAAADASVGIIDVLVEAVLQGAA